MQLGAEGVGWAGGTKYSLRIRSNMKRCACITRRNHFCSRTSKAHLSVTAPVYLNALFSLVWILFNIGKEHPIPCNR